MKKLKNLSHHYIKPNQQQQKLSKISSDLQFPFDILFLFCFFAYLKIKMSLKILFNPCDGLGHINACIGLAQALQLRGHRIYFFTNKQMAGQYRDRYGFEEFILHNNNESIDTIESATDDDNDDDDHPIKNNKLMNVIIESGLLSDMSPFEKLDLYDHNKNPNIFARTMSKQILNVHEQMLNIIDKLQPDLIIVDSMIVAPCILYGSYRWAFSWSANPILLYRSDRIPPMMSGKIFC